MKLKLKYRVNKPSGFKSKTNNKGERKKDVQGNGHRRKAYGPFNTF